MGERKHNVYVHAATKKKPRSLFYGPKLKALRNDFIKKGRQSSNFMLKLRSLELLAILSYGNKVGKKEITISVEEKSQLVCVQQFLRAP